MSCRIAVVGAGIAGLTAARRLAEAGHDCTVYEKARGTGGRSSTRRSGRAAFDHGAPDLGCRTAAFSQQLWAWRARGVVARWSPRCVALDDAGAVGPALASSPRYVGVPGMSAITRDLGAGLRIETGRRVLALDRHPDGWRLAFADGEASPPAEAVVVATPAPQAVPLLDGVPSLRRLASRVAFEPVDALPVAFEQPLSVDFDEATTTGGSLARVVRDSAKPGRTGSDAWTLHARPAWSRERREGTSPDCIGEELLDAFARLTGLRLPETVLREVHRWRLARASRPLSHGFLWDPAAALGVCGDWLSGVSVEDAFASGLALARRMSRDLAVRSTAEASA